MAHLYTKQDLVDLVKKNNLKHIKLSGAGRTKESIYQDLVNEGIITEGEKTSSKEETVSLKETRKPKKKQIETPSPKGTKKSTKEKAKVEESIYFFGHTGPYGFLSNFYPAIFEDEDGETFVSSEQYFMWRKATFFEDEEMADKILEEVTIDDFDELSTDGKKWKDKMMRVKKLGKNVRGFDEVSWKEERESAMLDGLKLKFDQNKHLNDNLINTGNKKLAEASPYDKIWGIGISKNQAEAGEKWQGQNLLGNLLEIVRADLQKKTSGTLKGKGTKTSEKVMDSSQKKKKKGGEPTLLDKVRANKIDPSKFFPQRGSGRTYV